MRIAAIDEGLNQLHTALDGTCQTWSVLNTELNKCDHNCTEDSLSRAASVDKTWQQWLLKQ